MASAASDALFVVDGDEQRTELKIDLRNPPTDWKEMLQRQSAFQTLSFTQSSPADDDEEPPAANAVVADTEQVIMQLVAALRSYPNHQISKIKLSCCRQFAELGMLCMAVISLLPATMPSRLLSLTFRSMKVDPRAFQTLCYLVENNLLEELCLEFCMIDYLFAAELQTAMKKNTSLLCFHFRSNEDFFGSPTFLLTGIRNILLTNRTNLVKLRLGVPDKETFWSIFRAATKGPEMAMLQHLELFKSHIPLQAMEALMMMCWVIPSLKDLHFNRCTFTQLALEFLNQTLCKRIVLEKLTLECCETYQPNQDAFDDVDCSVAVNFGKVQVRNLSLQGTPFEPSAFDQMMDDIGDNPFIKSLNMCGKVFDSIDVFGIFNEFLLQRNRGPSELFIDGIIKDDADVVIDALRHNSSIKVLTIQGTDVNDLLPFALSLANISNVCKLTFCFQHESIELPEVFLQALEQNMQHHTSLQSIVIRQANIKDELAQRYLPNICYYLAINRVKRNSLMTEPDVPNGVWAHVLSKTSQERDGIYFVLTGKPDIVTVVPVRKRKGRADDNDAVDE